MSSTIQLCNGAHFDFHRIDETMKLVTIEDIAHALSNICRFTGHTAAFYSVAQHSCIVSQQLPDELKLQGLLHDAHEAIVGDMASPLKHLIPHYQEIEQSVECAVRAHFGVRMRTHPEVKHADLVALATEKRDLMKMCDGSEWGVLKGFKPLRNTIIPEAPELARARFLKLYRELTGQW